MLVFTELVVSFISELQLMIKVEKHIITKRILFFYHLFGFLVSVITLVSSIINEGFSASEPPKSKGPPFFVITR